MDRSETKKRKRNERSNKQKPSNALSSVPIVNDSYPEAMDYMDIGNGLSFFNNVAPISYPTPAVPEDLEGRDSEEEEEFILEDLKQRDYFERFERRQYEDLNERRQHRLSRCLNIKTPEDQKKEAELKKLVLCDVNASLPPAMQVLNAQDIESKMFPAAQAFATYTENPSHVTRGRRSKHVSQKTTRMDLSVSTINAQEEERRQIHARLLSMGTTGGGTSKDGLVTPQYRLVDPPVQYDLTKSALFCKEYNSGLISSDWVEPEIALIPKTKAGSRTGSLLSSSTQSLLSNSSSSRNRSHKPKGKAEPRVNGCQRVLASGQGRFTMEELVGKHFNPKLWFPEEVVIFREMFVAFGRDWHSISYGMGGIKSPTGCKNLFYDVRVGLLGKLLGLEIDPANARPTGAAELIEQVLPMIHQMTEESTKRYVESLQNVNLYESTTSVANEYVEQQTATYVANGFSNGTAVYYNGAYYHSTNANPTAAGTTTTAAHLTNASSSTIATASSNSTIENAVPIVEKKKKKKNVEMVYKLSRIVESNEDAYPHGLNQNKNHTKLINGVGNIATKQNNSRSEKPHSKIHSESNWAIGDSVFVLYNAPPKLKENKWFEAVILDERSYRDSRSHRNVLEWKVRVLNLKENKSFWATKDQLCRELPVGSEIWEFNYDLTILDNKKRKIAHDEYENSGIPKQEYTIEQSPQQFNVTSACDLASMPSYNMCYAYGQPSYPPNVQHPTYDSTLLQNAYGAPQYAPYYTINAQGQIIQDVYYSNPYGYSTYTYCCTDPNCAMMGQPVSVIPPSIPIQSVVMPLPSQPAASTASIAETLGLPASIKDLSGDERQRLFNPSYKDTGLKGVVPREKLINSLTSGADKRMLEKLRETVHETKRYHLFQERDLSDLGVAISIFHVKRDSTVITEEVKLLRTFANIARAAHTVATRLGGNVTAVSGKKNIGGKSRGGESDPLYWTSLLSRQEILLEARRLLRCYCFESRTIIRDMIEKQYATVEIRKKILECTQNLINYKIMVMDLAHMVFNGFLMYLHEGYPTDINIQ